MKILDKIFQPRSSVSLKEHKEFHSIYERKKCIECGDKEYIKKYSSLCDICSSLLKF